MVLSYSRAGTYHPLLHKPSPVLLRSASWSEAFSKLRSRSGMLREQMKEGYILDGKRAPTLWWGGFCRGGAQEERKVGSADAPRNGEVVQRREGLRLHRARR